MSQQGYDLIVFDWDGTIADSIPVIVESLQLALLKNGHGEHSSSAIQNLIGLSPDHFIRELLPDAHLSEFQPLMAAYRQIMSEKVAQRPTKLFPGGREMLDLLAGNGCMIAIATSKGRKGLDRILAALELETYFDYTICGDESKPKPNPAMVETILTKLGADPRRCLMVGDTTYDLDMGRAAGVATAGVTHGAHDVSQLERSQPDHLFADLQELTRWLAQNT